MAIPEPVYSEGDFKTAKTLQDEIDALVDIIENLNFIKANDPEYLRRVADHIVKLSKIVNQISKMEK